MGTARSRIIAVAMTMAAATASPAVLAQAQEQGGYIGASFGQSKINGACDDLRTVFADFGGSVSSCDDKDTGFKIFGGYQVNRNFAVEGTYINWGEVTGSGTILGLPAGAKGEAISFGVAAVGILPLNERFSLFGKAGILLTQTDVTATLGAFSDTEDDSSTELHVGVGALFNVTKSFGLRFEWERAQDTEIDMISIGIQYRFD